MKFKKKIKNFNIRRYIFSNVSIASFSSSSIKVIAHPTLPNRPVLPTRCKYVSGSLGTYKITNKESENDIKIISQ